MEFEKLQKIIAEVLNIDTDKITMESTFVDDLGADSLDVFQIIMGIEDTFDIQIPEDAAEHITTVAEAVEQIQAAKAQAAEPVAAASRIVEKVVAEGRRVEPDRVGEGWKLKDTYKAMFEIDAQTMAEKGNGQVSVTYPDCQ